MASFDIPTILAAIVLTDLALAVSALLITLHTPSPELRSWAAALGAHATGMFMLAARPVLPFFLTVVVANSLISLGFALTHRSLRFFYQARPAPLLVLIPPVVTAIGFLFMADWVRVAYGASILVVQSILIVRELLIGSPTWGTGGRWVMMAGIVTGLAICAARALAAVLDPDSVRGLLHPTPVQGITFMASLIGIVLVSTGFIMMTKERSDEQLRGLAMRDRLTGCWNRIRIEEVAAQEMSRLERYALPVSLMIVDIDHFKAINDRLGHMTGDAVLRDVATAIGDALRTTDVLGRWGGEEFVAILPSTGLFEAIHLAERLRSALAAFPFSDGLKPTASIGVANLRAGERWEDWLARADAALYRAKTEGRDLVRWAAEDLPASRIDRETRVLRLAWRDELALGIPHLDLQHRALFETVNSLAFIDHPGTVAEIMNQILREMREHFRDEEEVLRERAFPRLSEHREQHRQLLRRGESLSARMTAGDIGQTEIFNFVIHELVARHFLIEDMACLSSARQDLPLPKVEFTRPEDTA